MTRGGRPTNIHSHSDRTASTMLAADLVGTTCVSRKPALLRSDAYSDAVRSRPPQLYQHHHIEHFSRMRDVAGRQHHLDNQQATGWVHRLADMAKDRQTPILVPIVDDVRENVSIASTGDACEEVASFYRYPIVDSLGL